MKHTGANISYIFFAFFLVIGFFSDSSISFFVCFVMGIGVVILGFMHDKEINQNTSKMKKELKDSINTVINSIEDFDIKQMYVSKDFQSALLLDEAKKKLAIVYNNDLTDLKFTYNLYDYSDILQSEIIEDGITLTKTSRGSQVGGALLGGILFGGVGAIIGGMGASTQTMSEVKKMQLQLVINDTKRPIYDVSFLTNENPIGKDNVIYKEAIKEANHWHGLFKVIIKQTDKEETDKNVEKITESKTNKSSISEELKELHNLLKEGILTQEEFDEQKQYLLAKAKGTNS